MPAGNLHIVAKVDTIEDLQAEIKKAEGFTTNTHCRALQ